MKERMDMIKRGMSWKEDFNIGFICFSSLRLDFARDIAAIEELIKTHKPLLLIVDTYRRAIGFDENDAGEVSKLFVETLRPLVDKYDFSVLFIHHHRKSSRSNSSRDEEAVVDEMDEMRGSSDFANYVDSIIKVERKSEDCLILKQLKNRNAPEEKPIKVGIHFEMNSPASLKMYYSGEFLKQSIQQKCSDEIVNFVTVNKLKNISVKQMEEIAFSKGYKKSNFRNALQDLIDIGRLEKSKSKSGIYDIKF